MQWLRKRKWTPVPRGEEARALPTCTLLPFVGPAHALTFLRHVHHVETSFYYYRIRSPIALPQIKGVDHTDADGRAVSLRLDPRTHTAHRAVVEQAVYTEIRSPTPHGTLLWRTPQPGTTPTLVVFRQNTDYQHPEILAR